MRTNPLGSFVARDTRMARVDARVKLVLLLAITISVFSSTNLTILLAWYVLLAVCMRLAQMSAADVARSVRPVLSVLVFTLAANLLILDGGGDMRLVGPVGLNLAGGLRGFSAVARIVLLAGFACVVSASTTPPELSDACVRLLRPLGRIGVPVADVGLVLSLALRFIPIVAEEYQRIHLAQRSRGVRFDEGPLVKRVRVWASVLTPLVVSLFRRADRLAESMAARCYTDGSAACVESRPLLNSDRVILALGLGLALALGIIAYVLV